MTRKPKPVPLDLPEALRGVTREDLADVLVKSESVKMKVAPTTKAEMKFMAQRCGLTLTAYLEALHAHAVRTLGLLEGPRSTPPGGRDSRKGASPPRHARFSATKKGRAS